MAALRIFVLACLAVLGASQVASAPMEDPLMNFVSLSTNSLIHMERYSLVRSSIWACLLQSTPEVTGIIKDATLLGFSIKERIGNLINNIKRCTQGENSVMCISQVLRDEYDNSEDVRDKVVKIIVRGQTLLKDFKECRLNGAPATTVAPETTTAADTETTAPITEPPTTDPEPAATETTPADPETTAADIETDTTDDDLLTEESY